TRFSRDWSSDVCSSDLRLIDVDVITLRVFDRLLLPRLAGGVRPAPCVCVGLVATQAFVADDVDEGFVDCLVLVLAVAGGDIAMQDRKSVVSGKGGAVGG